jgi:FkbH-like protein
MRQQFLESLRSLLGTKPGIVVIHSSLANLMPPPNVTKWDILFGLHVLIKEGWTVALPAFTFSFCSGTPFHFLRSDSETGILADWLLANHPDAVRSHHPIYSFVVAGPASEPILKCASSTAFGDDSPFQLFERENATLMMLGCDWEYASQFHHYEEQGRVPYRYFKDFNGLANFGDGSGEKEVQVGMYVRELAVEPSNDFSSAVSRLRMEGRIRSKALWRGRVESTQVADLAKVCMDMLNNDSMTFLANNTVVAYKLEKMKQAAEKSALRIAVLGSTNIHLLSAALESGLTGHLLDQRVEIYELPYGQLHQAVINQDSELRRWQPHISIFCDRLEDLQSQVRFDYTAQTSQLSELVEQYARLVADYHRVNGGWVIVHRFAMLYRSADESGGRQVAAMIEQMNQLLDSRLGESSQLLWVDVAAEAASENVPAVDFRIWHLGRMPFSEPLSRRLAQCWVGKILAVLGKSARVIVLDLDNTLWGGVLGEDGMEGLCLGGDFPGNAFLAFQRVIKTLSDRGIALAVCSKNDEKSALEAIETLPTMQIRSADIAAHRINWQAKWLNVQEIASELGLGLESFLFVDDNPVEREAVRRNLPAVKILDLPEDPAAYSDALISSPWLGVASVTPEDRKRVQGYKVMHLVEQKRRASVSLEDFYAGLEMKLHLQKLSDGNIARAVQLCMKTNQFNTTTRRYDQAMLRQIAVDGGDIVVLGLEDRYSGLENIGLLILRPATAVVGEGIIDNYLLSCRVLGRGLEAAVLHWALQRASVRRWTTLRGSIIETERNTPVRRIFSEAGFQKDGTNGEWMKTTSVPCILPSWLEIEDEFAVSVMPPLSAMTEFSNKVPR